MRGEINGKKYSEATGKLHLPCPHKGKTGISVHVVIKEGHCYRSEVCTVFECKFHKYQNDLPRVLSVVW